MEIRKIMITILYVFVVAVTCAAVVSLVNEDKIIETEEDE